MNISVIIPTLNAEKNISSLILDLQSQTLIPKEIIIIDSSSTDNTVKIAKEHRCHIVSIERASFDHGATRNLGAKLASGEILIFMTQDALPVNNMLFENLIAPLKISKLNVATFAQQVPAQNANPIEKHARIFNYPDTFLMKSKDDLAVLGIKTFFFSNVCSAIKKQAYEDVGGFPERIIMNEDMILAAKLILSGNKIIYCPDAKVCHSHNYNIIQYFKRYFDIGTSLNMNRWILQYAKIEDEGLKFFRYQINYLLKDQYWIWIPYALMLSTAKYLGFKLGLIQNKIPILLKKQFSFNTNFWRKRS